MTRRSWAVMLGFVTLATAYCGKPTALIVPDSVSPQTLVFAGEFTIPPLGRFPPAVGPPFGGISGLSPIDGKQWLAVCDDDGSRMYRLEITGASGNLRVSPMDVIGLQVGGAAPARLDGEGVAVTPAGTVIVASEGDIDGRPSVPPALLEYDMDGRFVRALPLRDRFVPDEAGTRGARHNAALESVTIAPGGDRLFTAFETAIVQDGEPAAIGRGTVARVLEYARDGDTYLPAREFAYTIEPVAPAPFDAAVTVSGLVELLALDERTLLALERTYVADRSGTDAAARSLNRIRLFRVLLGGATDIAAMESLAGASFQPLAKTLLLDLAKVDGLSPQLATLENFEGLAFGPRLADGSLSLLLVSDDNFHETQHTSFLLFRIGKGK